MAKTKRPDDGSACLLYTGHVNRHGFGVFGYDGKTWLAHRAVLTLSGYPLASWQCVRHRCSARLCINPEHLQVCTKADVNRAALKITHAKVAARRAAARQAQPPPPPKKPRVWPERRCTVCLAQLFGRKRRCKYCSDFCRRVDKTPDKERLCMVCARPLVWRFNRNQRKTCSAACRTVAMLRKPIVRPPLQLVCSICGKAFAKRVRSPSRDVPKTCSAPCAARMGHAARIGAIRKKH